MNNFPHKHIIIVLLLVSVLTFAGGAAARSSFQKGGPVWLDGVVGMLLGLTLGLWAFACGFGAYDTWHIKGRRRAYNVVVGFVFSIIGLVLGIIAFVSGLIRVANLIR